MRGCAGVRVRGFGGAGAQERGLLVRAAARYSAGVDTPGGAGGSGEARDRLWERLLDGQLTRVAVSCDIESTEVFKHFIPNSLGLERVWPHAHEQDRATGAWRTAAQLDRIARDLAAQDGWICGSGRIGWDTYFMENADAVLVFQTAARRGRMHLAAVRYSVSALAHAVLRRRSRFDDDGNLLKLRGPRQNRAYYSRTGYLALELYPEKTFVIDRRKYIRKLRSV